MDTLIETRPAPIEIPDALAPVANAAMLNLALSGMITDPEVISAIFESAQRFHRDFQGFVR